MTKRDELKDLKKEYKDLCSQDSDFAKCSFESFVNDTVRQNTKQYPCLSKLRQIQGEIIL